MLILAGSISNNTYPQKIKYKKNLGINWQKFKSTLTKYVIRSQWECNEQTSANRTKTPEKHQFKDIHRPLTTSTDIPASALI